MAELFMAVCPSIGQGGRMVLYSALAPHHFNNLKLF